MKTCILHIGMHKTGSSSIQESLWSNLRDSGFRYIEVTGHPNGCQFMNAAFLVDPRKYWVYQKQGLSQQKLFRAKKCYRRRLRKQLRRLSDTDVTPILSAEACWMFSADDLASIRDFMLEENYQTHIVVYLRPMKSWVESMIQEHVKFASGFTDFENFGDEFCRQELNYLERLQILEETFGADNIHIRPFTKTGLINRCAVTDFCQTVGIAFNPKDIVRSNDGLCADAVRMLHCYDIYVRRIRPPSLAASQLLNMHLKELKGDAFHLHSSVIDPIKEHIIAQNEKIHGRYGIDLHEDFFAHDQGPCIREHSDLLAFSQQSLDWLAARVHQPSVRICKDENTARVVAQQVNALLSRPSWRLRLKRLRQSLRLKLIEWLP
ncbi:MAG: hypothetical protein VKP63_06660 [Cyanobacteriota bacterium]|nr:hypothetical protein [Cyanobacteriota bacterium]